MNNSTRISTGLAAFGVVALVAGVLARPVSVGAQGAQPFKRTVVVVIVTTAPKVVQKAHVGIYRLSEFVTSDLGKQTTVPKNDLIMEQDMDESVYSTARLNQLLTPGEYEVHIQPDNSRPIVKRFIVDNLNNAPIVLRFDLPPIEDPVERQKTEYVRIGPSLGDMDNRLRTLTTQVEELRKKVGQ